MSRYIDADELCKDRVCNDPVRIAAMCAPTADVQEVKHGKWIKASEKAYIGMKCSRCKARIRYSEYFSGNYLYCHKCGAKMDEQIC